MACDVDARHFGVASVKAVVERADDCWKFEIEPHKSWLWMGVKQRERGVGLRMVEEKEGYTAFFFAKVEETGVAFLWCLVGCWAELAFSSRAWSLIIACPSSTADDPGTRTRNAWFWNTFDGPNCHRQKHRHSFSSIWRPNPLLGRVEVAVGCY